MASFEELEKILERLELTEYERKIYTTLLSNGPLSASEVGDISGITKFNIYPSLKRLVLKGFVNEQPTGRTSKYLAVPPLEVITILEEQLRSRQEKENRDLHEIRDSIFKIDINLDLLKGSSPSDSIWLINSEARIKKYVLELLQKSKNSILICLPSVKEHTYLQTRQEILTLLQNLMKEKKDKIILIMNWEIEDGTEDETIANTLTGLGGRIYQWAQGVLPFVAFFIDNSEGMIIFQSKWDPIPKFGLALWIRHPAYVKPFEKLIERFNEAGAFKLWT
jgi:sugar-specific transcriptional regulator TrmB